MVGCVDILLFDCKYGSPNWSQISPLVHLMGLNHYIEIENGQMLAEV